MLHSDSQQKGNMRSMKIGVTASGSIAGGVKLKKRSRTARLFTGE